MGSLQDDYDLLLSAPSPVEAALGTLVPSWMATVWPFERVRYPGRDLTWEMWLGLPDG